MSRWLTVAEGLFRRRVSDPPPPYEILCLCGRIVTGQRTKAAQTQACPDCRARLFVLPACVYPQPRAPKRKNVAVPQRKATVTGDEAVKSASASLAASTSTVRAPAEADKKPGAVSSKSRATLRTTVRSVAGRVDLERLRRKFLGPVRLVLAGVALVVGLTFWWIWHLHALGQAERTVVSAVKQAELALEEHDLGEAARQYRQVRRALDVLGRNDLRARALRQTAAEISAAADLARVSLFDMLHEASRLGSNTARESWAETFRSNYRDEWVVLDAQVSRSADPAEGRRYDIDFRLAEGLNQAVIVAELPAFDRAISSGGEPLRVIFAAQLDDCSPDPKHEHTWRIVLRPATGFLWSSATHLELLGVAADDETKQLLADQTVHLGISQ